MLQAAKRSAATEKSLPSNEASADVASSEEGSRGREIPIPQRGWKNPCMSA